MGRELVFTATFNERPNIARWIREVASSRPHSDILVVDDSSPDGTSELIKSMCAEFPQVTLITRSGKLGLNTAHLLSIQYAINNDYDHLVTMDADGSHLPSQIPRLVEALSPAEFVIGTRTHGGTHQASVGRRLLSRGANTTARVLLPMHLTEYTTSFRVFDRRALAAVAEGDFHSSGYAFFIECLEVMHRAGIVMDERPIDFMDRAGGTSKIPKNQIFVSMGALVALSGARWRARFAKRSP